jgi:hypothetical protein
VEEGKKMNHKRKREAFGDSSSESDTTESEPESESTVTSEAMEKALSDSSDSDGDSSEKEPLREETTLQSLPATMPPIQPVTHVPMSLSTKKRKQTNELLQKPPIHVKFTEEEESDVPESPIVKMTKVELFDFPPQMSRSQKARARKRKRLAARRSMEVNPVHDTETTMKLNPVHDTETTMKVNPVHDTETTMKVNPVHDTETTMKVNPVHDTETTMKDYSSLPLVHQPTLGTRIAFKVLEMTSAYTPEISDYKVNLIEFLKS